MKTIASQLEAQRADQRLKDAITRAKAAEEQVVTLQEQLEATIALKGARNVSITKPSKGKGKGDVTAVMVGSDWHVEERVEPGTVGGLNTFNLDVCAKRIHRFFTKGMFLTSGMSKFLNVNHLVLSFLGDIISNQLHEENLEANLLSPTEAILFAFEQMRAGVKFILAESPCRTLNIVCASGNHGRTIAKPRASTRTKHSFENLLYRFLAHEFAREPRIQFIIETGYHVYHPVAGWPIRWHHGDGVRYHGGVGGVYVPVGKAIAQWNRARSAYLDVFGHWHQSLDGGNFIGNGSLIGYNAYAVAIKATFEKPVQQFFLMDREHGKIATMPIFVE